MTVIGLSAGHRQSTITHTDRERDIMVGAAVHKPLITKMNAHLRVQWRKNHRHRDEEERLEG